MHPRLLLCSLVVLAVLPLPAAAGSARLDVHSEPATIYLERVGNEQAVNFELRLGNRGTVPLDLDRIEVTALDAAGHVLLRRFVDGNGVRPSLEVLGPRQVSTGATLTVFNPFTRFAAELPIARLHYEIEASTSDGATATARLDVLPRAYRNASAMELPLRGRMIHYDGHDYLGHHRRFDVHFAPIAAMGFRANFMRYSYDLVPVDASGAMYRGDAADNRSWLGFGQPIVAAADGLVVAATGDQPDNRRFDQDRLAANHWLLFGNYVVVNQGHGEYAVYAHAQQGSVTVKPGQRVRRGEPLARIGASGSAFFPHLHFQLQTGPGTDAEGLPSYFERFDRVIGGHLAARRQATVDTGEIVQAP